MLDEISTCWPTVNNPLQFVMRYAPAIRRYLTAIMKSSDAAEEVSQDFLVKVLERGFQSESVNRGRFRDYLKAAVRYTALSALRRRAPENADAEQLANLAADPIAESEADAEWIAQWRECLLQRVWQGLELHERKNPESRYYSVLRLVAQQPEATDQVLAEQLSQTLGRPYRADAFRQQKGRARRQFAELILAELKQSLREPTREAIEAELLDIDLMKYVRDYLP